MLIFKYILLSILPFALWLSPLLASAQELPPPPMLPLLPGEEESLMVPPPDIDLPEPVAPVADISSPPVLLDVPAIAGEVEGISVEAQAVIPTAPVAEDTAPEIDFLAEMDGLSAEGDNDNNSFPAIDLPNSDSAPDAPAVPPVADISEDGAMPVADLPLPAMPEDNAASAGFPPDMPAIPGFPVGLAGDEGVEELPPPLFPTIDDSVALVVDEGQGKTSPDAKKDAAIASWLVKMPPKLKKSKRKKTFNYKKQILPDPIYKTAYNRFSNRHLPVRMTTYDYEVALVNAAARNDINGVRALLNYGVPVNSAPGGETALAAAQRSGAIDVVRLLRLLARK